jgi:hypothetical protein
MCKADFAMHPNMTPIVFKFASCLWCLGILKVRTGPPQLTGTRGRVTLDGPGVDPFSAPGPSSPSVCTLCVAQGGPAAYPLLPILPFAIGGV